MTSGENGARRYDEQTLRNRAEELGLGDRIALADELRGLVETLACTRADPLALRRAREAITQAKSALDAAPREEYAARSLDGRLFGFGTLSELGPFTGRMHALAPPMELTLAPGRADAVTTYGPAHVGGPGIVHGGFIAATFDELLCTAQRGTLRMTGELSLRYLRPARIGRTLRYTAWLDRVEGRKAHVLGQLHDGDVLCAEAKALFIALDAVPFAMPTSA